jgi:hypothetical protein
MNRDEGGGVRRWKRREKGNERIREGGWREEQEEEKKK